MPIYFIVLNDEHYREKEEIEKMISEVLVKHTDLELIKIVRAGDRI